VILIFCCRGDVMDPLGVLFTALFLPWREGRDSAAAPRWLGTACIAKRSSI
jgi:hypothetical protein